LASQWQIAGAEDDVGTEANAEIRSQDVIHVDFSEDSELRRLKASFVAPTASSKLAVTDLER
jgi:hypothetical protein